METVFPYVKVCQHIKYDFSLTDSLALLFSFHLATVTIYEDVSRALFCPNDGRKKRKRKQTIHFTTAIPVESERGWFSTSITR